MMYVSGRFENVMIISDVKCDNFRFKLRIWMRERKVFSRNNFHLSRKTIDLTFFVGTIFKSQNKKNVYPKSTETDDIIKIKCFKQKSRTVSTIRIIKKHRVI